MGPNNVGESNVAGALKFVREVVCKYISRERLNLFINKYSDKREFKLEIGFSLDKEEIKDLNLFLEIFADSISKKANISNTDIEEISPSLNKEEIKKLLSKFLKQIVQRLFQIASTSIIVRYIEEISPVIDIVFNVNGNKIKLDNRNCICRSNISDSFPVRDLKGWLIEFLKVHQKIEIEKLLNFILEGGCLSLGELTIHQVVNDGKKGEISFIFYKYNYSSLTESTQLDIWIVNGSIQTSIDYTGGGFLEFLNVFSVVAGNRNCIIVLDEPALHLHPSKQRKLTKLVNTAKSKKRVVIPSTSQVK